MDDLSDEARRLLDAYARAELPSPGSRRRVLRALTDGEGRERVRWRWWGALTCAVLLAIGVYLFSLR
jgi:hypothetical protein